MIEPIPYPIYFLIIPIGLRLTCYYFHGWYEERIVRPLFKKFFGWKQLAPNFISNILLRGFNFDMIHRYFLILSIPLIFVHITISLYHTLVNPVLWVQLDSLQNLGSVAYSLINPTGWSPNFGPFHITEWFDSIMLALYVGSCHVVRYFLGSGKKCDGCTCKQVKALNAHTKFNIRHGFFFWISVFSVLLHSAVVLAINTGLLTL